MHNSVFGRERFEKFSRLQSNHWRGANSEHNLRQLGKAGATRWREFDPQCGRCNESDRSPQSWRGTDRYKKKPGESMGNSNQGFSNQKK